MGADTGNLLMITVAVIVVLLILSALFSGSETALTAASRPLMHELEKDGNLRAATVNRLLEKRERLIGTILLGNNLVNILASALATSVMMTLFGEAGVVYATIAMTILVLIFSEILPKTLALTYTTSMALRVAPVMRVLVWLLSPVVSVIQAIVEVAMRLFHRDGADHQPAAMMLAELRGVIDLHTRAMADKSADIQHERAMLRSVLDLADVEVSEIMIHRRNLATIDVDQPVNDIIDQVLTSPYTRLPLWRDKPDNIVGVLHAKALARAVQEHTEQGTLDQMDPVSVAAPPWFIPDATRLLDQLQAFRARREHFAMVVDEYGSLQGVVTLEDILEEIVGEIADEHDVAVTGVRPQPDGSYVIDGDVTIRDLNRQFDWSLPDDEAATIAGLVLHESRSIPDVGQTFLFHGFRFEVLRRQRNQITALKVSSAATQDGAS
jgi:Mg2+/Co2+ transporter CorB